MDTIVQRERWREATRRYRNKNRKRHLAMRRASYKRNPEPSRVASRAWRKSHLKESASRMAEWRKKNRKRWRAIANRANRKRYANPLTMEKQRESNRCSYKKHVTKRRKMLRTSYAANRLGNFHRVHKRRAIAAGADGRHTHAEWIARVVLYKWRCAYCNVKLTLVKKKINTLTKDHIMPLSRGGSNWADNLAPACGSCNKSKHDKIVPR